MSRLIIFCFVIMVNFIAFGKDLVPNRCFHLGIEGFRYNYDEPDVMKLKGYFGGIFGSYQYVFFNYFILPEFRASIGETNYTSDISGNIYNKLLNYLLETRILIGKPLIFNSTVEFSPYLGFGHRYKYDNSCGEVTSKGKTGYIRKSHYYYLPVGFRIIKQISCSWSIAGRIEYDFFLYGKNFSGAKTKVWNTQRKGYGLKGEILITLHKKGYNVSFIPFFNYWNVRDSDKVPVRENTFWYEPSNKTSEIGIKMLFSI